MLPPGLLCSSETRPSLYNLSLQLNPSNPDSNPCESFPHPSWLNYIFLVGWQPELPPYSKCGQTTISYNCYTRPNILLADLTNEGKHVIWLLPPPHLPVFPLLGNHVLVPQGLWPIAPPRVFTFTVCPALCQLPNIYHFTLVHIKFHLTFLSALPQMINICCNLRWPSSLSTVPTNVGGICQFTNYATYILIQLIYTYNNQNDHLLIVELSSFSFRESTHLNYCLDTKGENDPGLLEKVSIFTMLRQITVLVASTLGGRIIENLVSLGYSYTELVMQEI